MNRTIRAVAALSGMLAVLLAVGCGTRAASGGRASVPGCTAYGLHAIEQQITATRMPAACLGLSKAQVNFALGRAIFEAEGSGQHKVAWRRRAVIAGAVLGSLISQLPAAAGSRPGRYLPPGPPGPGAEPSRALGIGTLVAWLLTAASGGYMLGGWLARGGHRQQRVRGEGLAPAVIFGHFGLASGGLLVWVGYLATNWPGLAWLAVGLLLPVVGLGISTVTLWIPSAAGAELAVPAESVPAGRLTDAVLARALTDDVLVGRLVDDVVANMPGDPSQVTRKPRGHLAALIPAGHGVAAIATVLLALLTAVGVS